MKMFGLRMLYTMGEDFQGPDAPVSVLVGGGVVADVVVARRGFGRAGCVLAPDTWNGKKGVSVLEYTDATIDRREEEIGGIGQGKRKV